MSDDVLRLAHECDALLAQIDGLLRTCGREALARPAPGGGGSAAAHLRHCLEFVGCFLAGLPGRCIDYDARPRDLRLESEPEAARARIAEQRRALRSLAASSADATLRVRADEPDAAPGEGFLASCVSRELRALASHTVHHLAFVALLLRLEGIAVDPHLGVAPSTQAHQRRAG